MVAGPAGAGPAGAGPARGVGPAEAGPARGVRPAPVAPAQDAGVGGVPPGEAAGNRVATVQAQAADLGQAADLAQAAVPATGWPTTAPGEGGRLVAHPAMDPAPPGPAVLVPVAVPAPARGCPATDQGPVGQKEVHPARAAPAPAVRLPTDLAVPGAVPPAGPGFATAIRLASFRVPTANPANSAAGPAGPARLLPVRVRRVAAHLLCARPGLARSAPMFRGHPMRPRRFRRFRLPPSAGRCPPPARRSAGYCPSPASPAGCFPRKDGRPPRRRRPQQDRWNSRLLQKVDGRQRSPDQPRPVHHSTTPGWVKYQKAELNHTTVSSAASNPPSTGIAQPGNPRSRRASILAAKTP